MKRKQGFVVENSDGELIAMGHLYDDGNVAVQWRRAVGFTSEQYHSIALMFGIEWGATGVRFVDELPEVPQQKSPMYIGQMPSLARGQGVSHVPR